MVTTQTTPARPVGEAGPAWHSTLASFTTIRGVRAGALWGASTGFGYQALPAVVLALFGRFPASDILYAVGMVAMLGPIAAVVGAVVGIVTGLVLGVLIGIAADLLRAPARFPSYVAATLGTVASVPLVLLLALGTASSEDFVFGAIVFTVFPMIMATAGYRHAAAVRDRYPSWQL